MSRSWEKYLSERDRMLAWGKPGDARDGFGSRPVVLQIDNYYAAVGIEREDVVQSRKKWGASAGLEGWAAIDKTVDLLRAARANGVPVIHALNTGKSDHEQYGARGARLSSTPRERTPLAITPEERMKGYDPIEEVKPLPGEMVIMKASASAFLGTSLVMQLNYLEADTVICCGEATSGCVRATVVDGAMYRYRMAVVEECTYDHEEAPHFINLFDMHARNADVVFLDETIAYLDSIGAKNGVGAAAMTR